MCKVVRSRRSRTTRASSRRRETDVRSASCGFTHERGDTSTPMWRVEGEPNDVAMEIPPHAHSLASSQAALPQRSTLCPRQSPSVLDLSKTQISLHSSPKRMKYEMLALIALLAMTGCGGTPCPADQRWSECAHASCEDCTDCVGACVEGSGGEEPGAEPTPSQPAGVTCGGLTCGPGETCDDCGSDPSCPQCDVCVPTCVGSSDPEGSAQQGDGHGCSPGEVWDECAHGSCEVCADCVGACVSRVSP